MKRPVEALIEGERERLVLWLPVALACGIGLYFFLPVEPPIWIGLVSTAVGVGLSVIARRRLDLLIGALGLLAVALGFLAAEWRSTEVEGVLIERRVGPTRVEAQVESLEHREKDMRVTLVKPRIKRLAPYKTPFRIRLVLRGDQPHLRIGDWIDALAVVTPPPPPTAPGAFDFQRVAYFQELGGTGFGLGPVTLLRRDQRERFNFLDQINQIRLEVAHRIGQAVSGDTGAVINALMTGQRGEISDSTWEHIRGSGLAHLLAISGLHLGLIGATMFFSLRFLFALNAKISLVHDTKKWAAVLAVLGTLAYTLFTGVTIPTQRAFLMTGLVMLAIMIDRDPFSMRLVAVSAALILLIRPESLLNASFQMSFAAVVGLVSVFEVLNRLNFHGFLNSYSYTRPLAYLITVAIVTLVASLATAPYTLFHFHQIAAYGLVANLISVPVMALWIMPLSVVSFMLMPFDLAGLPLQMMGWGVDVVLACAKEISNWPGASLSYSAISVWSIVLVSLGGLWLCLWATRWRFLGLIGVGLFFGSIALGRPPDLLIDAEGRFIAVRDSNGQLYFSSLRGGRMNRESWLRRAGSPEYAAWPRSGVMPLQRTGGSLACDVLGCAFKIENQHIALIANPMALFEDCRRATILVTPDYLDTHCRYPRLILDRESFLREGAHAFWFDANGFRMETVNQYRGDRPWVVRPKR